MKRIDWDIVLMAVGVVFVLRYLYLDLDHIGPILAGVIVAGAEQRWMARRSQRRKRPE